LCCSLRLTAVCDGRLERELDRTRVATSLLQGIHHLLALVICDLAENHVLSVQPTRDGSGDEELAAVCVGSCVGHAQQVLLVVGELEVLVCELLAVDRLAAGAVAPGEVTALEHEAGDDSVEGAALEAEALLASAEGSEVLGGLGDDVVVEGEVDSLRLWRGTVGLGVLHIEEDVLRHLGCLCGFLVGIRLL